MHYSSTLPVIVLADAIAACFNIHWDRCQRNPQTSLEGDFIMAKSVEFHGSSFLLLLTVLLVLATPTAAFGAGNIGKPPPRTR